MTDKKYTDKEIISSLKIIATTRNCNECKIRNCKWGTCNCEQITANAALDLIKRQNAEIERLKKEKDEYAYLYDKHVNTAFSHIKSEAYKEFAKFLIDKASKGLIHVSDLPDFVKEMVGEEE